MRNVIFGLVLVFFCNLSFLLIPEDTSFLTTLNIVSFMPSNLYNWLWFGISILLSYSFYKLLMEYEFNSNYTFVLIINYIFLQLFRLFFFVYHSLIFSVIITSIITISSLFLFLETKKINKNIAYLIIPYFIFNSVCLINIMVIYLLN